MRLFRRRVCRHERYSTIYFRHLPRIDGAGPGGIAARNECLDCGATANHIALDTDGSEPIPGSPLAEQKRELEAARTRYAGWGAGF